MKGITRRVLLGAGLAGAAGAAFAGWKWWSGAVEPPPVSDGTGTPQGGPGSSGGTPGPVLTSYEDLMGCHFTPADRAPLTSIATRLLPLPEFPGRTAIWGATGRDHRGHLWFGVSASGVPQASARLLEYDPAADTLQLRGDVVGELRRAGLLRSGEGQMKIHSRIVQGEDGHLYFTSMDEEGEATDGSRLPTWGSHLWRLRLPERRWEHLRAVREALIAVATAGRWVYALGYFDHVVYQYDVRSGTVRSTTVGSLGGHISRNFFCDIRGHVYVPRPDQGPGGTPTVALMELDTDLRKVHETPIDHYTVSRDDDSHGLTGVQPLADQSVAFVTDQGYLYRVVPRPGQAAQVEDLGWFHPQGRRYVASLFTSDGRQHLMGMTYHNAAGGRQYEWLVFDLNARTSTATPMILPAGSGRVLTNVDWYGSISRDDQGGCYLGGYYMVGDRGHPLLLQVKPLAA
jgi:hypothetical protein